MTIRLLCLGFIMGWSSFAAADEREAARQVAEAKQQLVDLVDSLAADAPQRAEKAYAVAVAGGKADLRSSYALALVRTRHGAYREAADVLDALPNADKRQPAIMRLRLWLALELGENAKADRIFLAVTTHLSDRSIRNPERLETAKTLGAISTLMAALPPEAAPIASSTLQSAAATVKTKAAEDYAAPFAASGESTAKRLDAVKALVAEVESLEEAERPEMLARRTEEYDRLRGEVIAAQGAIDNAWSDHRAKAAEEAEPLKVLRQRSTLLHREARRETPGKPAVPRKPSMPRRPRGEKDKDDKPSAAEMRKYEKALDEYEDDLRDYERDLATYPQRLAAWQEVDLARRREIKAYQDVVDAGLQEIEGKRETRLEAIGQQRLDLEKQERAAGDLWLEIGLLKSLSTGDFATAAPRVPALPSSYKIISFSAEQKRIMQLLE